MSVAFPTQLFQMLENSPENAILHVDKSDYGYSFHLGRKMNTSSHLADLIGKSRFSEICELEELRLDKKAFENNSAVLTKADIRKILVGFAYLEFHRAASPGNFSIRNMNQIHQIMMGCAPRVEDFMIDRPKTSGHGYLGLIQRVYLTYLHCDQLAEDKVKDKEHLRIRDVEFLTSRLGDRELRLNSLIYLSDGIFTVTANFIGKGAYVSVLVSEDGSLPPKIVCRGTATRLSATEGVNSAINDLLLEIGSFGVKYIWPVLSEYLVRNKFTSVDLLGKSLGGAHAQQLTILIEGLLKIRVNSLTTLCSVGVGEDTNTLFFTQILAQRKDDPFNLCVIRNGGDPFGHHVDYIPAIGGEHLGYNAPEALCNKQVIYIVPSHDNAAASSEDIHTISSKGGKCGLSIDFFCSFANAHSRQSTIKSFRSRHITPHQKADKHLGVGRLLEPYRRRIANIFDLFTCFRFNRNTITDFYYNQQAGIWSMDV